MDAAEGDASARDEERYLQENLRKEQEWEALCCRCGACCGAFEDPCRNLVRNADNTFHCAAYEHRLGMQQTVGGKEFCCVPIRVILAQHWQNDRLCAYKKQFRNAWIPESEP